MTIDDLILLLNNRLREFQLSRDYARMNGDLERMNAADKEVLALEDTLFKLNLLIDTTKSAAVKEAILAEVITDGSVSVLDEYDITSYATDPLHEKKIMDILSKMGVMDTVEKIDKYIGSKSWWNSPVTGEMVMNAAQSYKVDTRLMMAIMEQDSRFGTVGKAVRTLNPGNVGNDDSGNLRTYDSWQEGVTAVAEWLSRHRGSTIIPEIPEILDMATSTPSMATSTPMTATSTPLIIPSTTATTTPTIITSTTTTATTTPATATSTPETIPVTTSTTTTTTASSTPAAATTTPEVITPTETATTTPTTATSTPEAATSTPETIPVTTSTTTTTTATSTTAN